MKKKHTHIGAYGIIYNDNKIALIRKGRGGYTGLLDLPGGGIEHDESPSTTLVRELMEEAGVRVIKYKLLDVRDSNIVWKVRDNFFEDLHHIGVIYLVKTEDNDIKKEADGIDSLGSEWYDINELDLDLLTPFAKYAVTYLRDNTPPLF